MQKNALFGLTLCMGLIGGAYSENDVDPMVQINAGVVKLSASMNMLAVECGDMTEKEVEQARAKQRESAINDLKMSEKDYENLYAQFAAEMKQQWSGASAADKKKACAQVQSIPR